MICLVLSIIKCWGNIMVVEMLPHLQGSSEAFLGRSWESCSIKESYSIKFDQRDISDVQESRSEKR